MRRYLTIRSDATMATAHGLTYRDGVWDEYLNFDDADSAVRWLRR